MNDKNRQRLIRILTKRFAKDLPCSLTYAEKKAILYVDLHYKMLTQVVTLSIRDKYGKRTVNGTLMGYKDVNQFKRDLQFRFYDKDTGKRIKIYMKQNVVVIKNYEL